MIEDESPPHSLEKNENIETSKNAYRKQVWDQLMKNKLNAFPLPYGRIPNFKGADAAAAKLSELEEFKSCKSIEINPDKPLEHARILALKQGKELFVSVPRLENNLLKKLSIQEGTDIERTVSRWGIDHTGQNIDINDKIHIDLIVMGSVAVSKEGHRIGKGKGYGDLEYALLKEMQAVDDSTVIVTTVHDIQVFDTLPKELFKKHDVPVDFIITPTQIIKTENRPPRPEGVYWELLSQRQLSSMKVLRKLKARYKENNPNMDNVDEKRKVRPYSQLRNSRKLKPAKTDEVNSNSEKTLEENNENIPPKKPKRKNRNYNNGFSLLVKNIERSIRVRDLKKALTEKDIKPYSITWKGHRGYCFLHYASKKMEDEKNEPLQIDNVIEILKELQITPESTKKLLVKVMEPITRIETTDVTSV